MQVIPPPIVPLFQSLIYQLKKKYRDIEKDKELDLDDQLIHDFAASYIKEENKDIFVQFLLLKYNSYTQI